MSEIVYTETDQRRGDIADMGHGRRQADRKFTLFQSRDKVALVTSSLVVGVPLGRNKDKGYKEPLTDKRYYYWRSHYSFGFRRNRAGNIVPYQCQRPWDSKWKDPWKHQQARAPFSILNGNDEPPLSRRLIEEFRRAVWATFGVTSINDIFPMMPVVGLEYYHTIPYTLHTAFRTDNWDDYTAATFGRTRVTPRLVAAVKGAEPYHVAYARNFRGLVDNDKVVEYLERNAMFDEEMEEGFRPHTPDFRKGVLAAGIETRNALIDIDLTLEDMKRIQSITSVQKSYMARSFQRAWRGNVPLSWKEITHGR
jgi:hypothetical protein